MSPRAQFNPRFEACGFHPEEIVARRRDLTAGQKLLYDRLVRWARVSHGERSNERAGEVWRSQPNIAQELAKSSKQVARDLAKLESIGLLGHKNSDGRKSNTYFFLFHPDFERTSMSSQTGPVRQVEQTPVSVQMESNGTGSSDLNGHPRPVTSSLNGHPRPSNQKVVNQQSHTPQHYESSEEGTKPSTGPRASANSLREKQTPPRRGFPAGGWNSPTDFDAWWTQLVRIHPNRNSNALARTLAMKLIAAGILKRSEFDDGYSALATSQVDRWAEQSGRYAPNLHKLLEDRLWQHARDPVQRIPMQQSVSSYEGADAYLTRCGIQ